MGDHHVLARHGHAGFAGSDAGAQALVVRVTTDNRIEGLGNVGVGVAAVQPIIEQHLTLILLGTDPFGVELLRERMFRSIWRVPY